MIEVNRLSVENALELVLAGVDAHDGDLTVVDECLRAQESVVATHGDNQVDLGTDLLGAHRLHLILSNHGHFFSHLLGLFNESTDHAVVYHVRAFQLLFVVFLDVRLHEDSLSLKPRQSTSLVDHDQIFELA